MSSSEHHAKIIPVYTMQFLQYYCTIIFIKDKMSPTYFLPDNAGFDDSTAYGACFLFFDLQCGHLANND
ncbi:MAG TPA: hypothetical protein VE226_03850 [Nitrososphaeraceae archaeon]|nr:hypothetical protein [Nitrososphaeraceae archaeon]